jgi:hypothetical protein
MVSFLIAFNFNSRSVERKLEKPSPMETQMIKIFTGTMENQLNKSLGLRFKSRRKILKQVFKLSVLLIKS